MSKLVNEVEFVRSEGDGLLLIRYERFSDDGAKLGGDFVFEAGAAGWLADHIEAAADPCGIPDLDQVMPPDHFLIFARGGEHGEDTNVHLHNLRDPGAQRGGTYTLSGISPAVARNIATQLRVINP